MLDGKKNLLATGLRGRPQQMAGDFIITYESGDALGLSIFTYTFNGELLAASPPDRFKCQYIGPVGEYVCIYAKNLLICDRYLNILYELQYGYNKETGIYVKYYINGPNVLFNSDYNSFLNRTYLPDGTRLVTWYDPGTE